MQNTICQTTSMNMSWQGAQKYTIEGLEKQCNKPSKPNNKNWIFFFPPESETIAFLVAKENAQK